MSPIVVTMSDALNPLIDPDRNVSIVAARTSGAVATQGIVIPQTEWHLVKAQEKRVLSNGFSGHAAFLRRQPPNR
jgi:hypothetical protein